MKLLVNTIGVGVGSVLGLVVGAGAGVMFGRLLNLFDPLAYVPGALVLGIAMGAAGVFVGGVYGMDYSRKFLDQQ